MTEETIQQGKTMAFVSYLTLVGLLVALVVNGEKRNPFTSFHVRQSLGLWITFMALGYIIGYFDSWLITFAFWIFFGVLFIYSFMTAVSGKAEAAPLVGKLYQRIFSAIGK
jgi:uncharacterized membrane protein